MILQRYRVFTSKCSNISTRFREILIIQAIQNFKTGVGMVGGGVEQSCKIVVSLDPFNIGHWILQNQEEDIQA